MARSTDFYFSKLCKFLEFDTIKPVGEYIDRKTRMNFFCGRCEDEFTALVGDVYAGSRCTHCSGKSLTRKAAQKTLDNSSKQISILSDYVDSTTHMKCGCDVCGYLWSSTYSNLKINSCPMCSKRVKGSILELENIAKANGKRIKILSPYINRTSSIICLCQECNTEWKTVAASIVNGTGCPNCAPTGYNPSVPASLYYLRITDGGNTYWKIGITAKSVDKRFSLLVDQSKITVLYTYRFESGADARAAEQNILKLYKDYKVDKSVKPLSQGGNTELFTHDVLQMDHLGGVT